MTSLEQVERHMISMITYGYVVSIDGRVVDPREVFLNPCWGYPRPLPKRTVISATMSEVFRD